MRAQLVAAVRAVLVFTVLVGVAYPLAVTGVAQIAFEDEADGSLVERDGRIVGSRLIGQAFEGVEWFHPRPSAAGDGYDAMASSPSNLGPTNDELLDAAADRVAGYREANGLAASVAVPVDAVTASASGLDPHISVANARRQAPRVARARGRDVSAVLRLVAEHTASRALGFVGEEAVNVLELNLALDGAE
jgi:potassium-transporting ATPase KdpC subunit